MEDSQRLMAERACERLVTQFCDYVDSFRHEDLVGLWAEDAEWITWQGPVQGHDAIRAYLAAKPQTGTSLHVVQNVTIDVDDPENARGRAVFLYFGSGEDAASALVPQVIGRYDDRYRLTSDGWKFARRDTEIVFSAG
ncbi:nuclear transport factor 2 family protein [Oricola sp.]|uniref:nuclear transport factor 2 family protein n=1 Tax=Oricola sp. TaxID=1979950 RepID=UPI0025DEC748|nr:nuclear transport factor 2 family protein [Oricola sp.]MCI5074471.1 nuclear transport factor 2 family protein [Oricola sp.]